jgi:hypothetical protein
MAAHAMLSPSSAARWIPCPGSVALSRDIKDASSSFADEGTAAHELAAKCLIDGSSTQDCIGWVITVNGTDYTVDAYMADYVGGYVKRVRDLVESLGGELLVEQRLDISGITGEEDAGGTSDSVILLDDEIIIVDLKYGQGVQVDAEDNPQLGIYALAAIEKYDILGTVERVRMIIDQPRKHHYSEAVMTAEELQAFRAKVQEASMRCDAALRFYDNYKELHDKYLNPGEKQCKFCPAKATCPKLRDAVTTEVWSVTAATADDFDNMDAIPDTLTAAVEQVEGGLGGDIEEWLGAAMSKVGLVEDWCKAIRAEVARRLLEGADIPGHKLVKGRRGDREWSDTEKAESTLKAMRLKVEQMYDLKLISPTTAEKLAKSGAIGPRQWPKLQDMITQSDGKPSVAPASDKRPALVIKPVADDFDAITNDADGLV